MASIGTDPGGQRRILFVAPDGKRKTLRLGKVPQKVAEAVRTKVESLLAANLAKQPMEPETAAWVGSLDRVLADKLAAVGLVRRRDPKPGDGQQQGVTLAAFIDQYIAGRTDVKERTIINLKQAGRNLVRYFGRNKLLHEITPGDADDFRREMLTRLSENTVRRHCGRAKQFFRTAVRKRLIAESPFADMKGCGVKANASRFYFVSRDEAQKVLDACPDAEWRLLFALSRFGGLRCPSEHLGLRWADIDWERGRMTIRSPKTAHHEGKESRVVPLFPELRPYLEDVFDQAEVGTYWVITHYRDSSVNLRTQLERIIARAGLTPWPKLFQNLRSTRETELVETFPVHVVCAWLGNSPAIANKHYLQVRDEDFERAIQGGEKGGTESGTLLARNQAQQAAARNRKLSQEATQALGSQGLVPNVASACETVQNYVLPPDGLEPSTL